MQITIRIHADTPLTLPMNYRHIQQAVVYSLISPAGGTSDLHEGGYSFGNRKYKLFTFGPIFGHCEREKGRISFSGDFGFSIRALDPVLIANAAANLEKSGVRFGEHVYGDVAFSVENTPLTPDRVMIHMLSPICLYSTNPDTGRTTYYNPYQERFSLLAEDNFARKYCAAFGEMPESGIRLTPVRIGPLDKLVTRYKNLIIEAYGGRYLLEGDPTHIAFLYDTGIGAKNAQGFGMFEVAENNSDII